MLRISKMEDEDSLDEKNFSIKLEDSIEILTTDDARLSIIGEELANETGRSILTKLFEGVTSVSEIAVSLNISIPLVRWHIQRLLKANLITIDHIDVSEKNRKIKRYRPIKIALVIIPSHIAKSNVYSDTLKSALKKTYKTFLGFSTFIISSSLIYQLETNYGPNVPTKINQSPNGTSMKIGQILNNTIQTSQLPHTNQAFYISQDLMMSLILGSIVGISAWVILKILTRKNID